MTERVKAVLGVMRRVNHALLMLEKSVLVVLMVGMLIFGFLQVFSRYILKAPISWSAELLTYSFAWTSFVAAGMAVYTNSHFSVDLVVKHFPAKLYKVVMLVIWALTLGLAVFLMYYGGRLAIANTIQRMNILPLSMFWVYITMPVCGFFMFFHGIEKTMEVLYDIEPEHIPEEEIDLQ